MKIDFYSYSGSGGRSVNEDSYISRNGCYIVLDGLDGRDNGEVTFGAAVRYIAENFVSSDFSNERIRDLILGADEAVKRSGLFKILGDDPCLSCLSLTILLTLLTATASGRTFTRRR